MTSTMQAIHDAIEAQASAQEMAALEVPRTYRAVTLRLEDLGIFDGIPPAERDPHRTMHVAEVPTPELAPGEVLVASMASSINHNTVWSAIFEPLPTFLFLKRVGRRGGTWTRHAQPYHVIGSDAAGVVLRTGPGVERWKPGDRVLVHPAVVDFEYPEAHDDGVLDPQGLAWGYETNFGGLADLCVARASQLLPKPAHLTWEEAACNGLAASTVYRQLVSRNGGAIRQGEVVLVWGAAGGIGSYAVQFVLNGGAYPVAVVSSPERAALVRSLGCEWVIDRRAEGYRFWDGERMNVGEMRRFGTRIRELTGGEDPAVVFEHSGRETFAASVYVTKRGGRITTCAATSGWEHVYDNRVLWMAVKRIIGSHGANLAEAAEANRLIARGAIHPTLSACYPLEAAADAAATVHENRHAGKAGVLCLAESEGLGVTDPALRRRHLDAILRFRRGGSEPEWVRPRAAATAPLLEVHS